MRILASDVQMEALSRRSVLKELSREQLNVRRTEQDQNAPPGGRPVGMGNIIGVSQDTRVEYDQRYQQYSYRHSDVYSFDELMKAGSSAEAQRSFTDSSFIEHAISAVFTGKSAARFLIPSSDLGSSVAVAARSIDSGSLAQGGIQLTGTVIDASQLSVSGTDELTAVGTVDSSAISVSGTGLMRFNQYTLSQVDQTQLFNGHGSVTTADGRVINFGLYLAMDRHERIETRSELLVQSRPMTDPLVINFGAESAQLRDQYFDFDVDGDGVTEKIGTLAKGSGYLVFDRNQNGKVDDGTELFGPQSGSGFGELAQYDSDGNLWIDEGDPIFQELQVWVTSETGEESLKSLSEVGVGAIYLGSADADFDLVSPDGVALGRVKANGLYLTESGEVRSVQEIDLANQAANESAAPEVMTSSEMDEQIKQAQLGITDEDQEDQARPVIADISMAIERMNQLREDQKAFGESLSEDENKSVLSQLVEALEKALAANREAMEDDSVGETEGMIHNL
ncbi:hypothetical protein ACFOEK_20550 [Litoribrevibacter euphylliae]|uniref:Uncharacterized protein n=1 Tax=Litoribrevibacter euphylliae TaxID=1834034 RepID=A0ABV7HLG3_9GAMM